MFFAGIRQNGKVTAKMKSILHAGYVLPAVFDTLVASGMVGRERLRGLLRSWCVVEAEAEFDLGAERQTDDPVLMTAANLVARGLPTLSGLEMQEHFDRSFERTATVATDAGRIAADVNGMTPAMIENMLDVLRAVDPRVSPDDALRPLASSKASPLLMMMLPALKEVFGAAVTHLLTTDEAKTAVLLPFPSPLNGIRGLRVFAVGKDSENEGGVDADAWYHIPVREGDRNAPGRHLKQLSTLLPDDALPLAVQDERMLKPEGAEILQLILSPLAAARIQAALVACILTGKLELAAPKWRIAVIERDVPGAGLAISDLRNLFTSLFVLEGKGRTLPDIELIIHTGGVFAPSKLHAAYKATITQKESEIPEVDCCIDASMLLRSGLPCPEVKVSTPRRITLRTARDTTAKRRLRFGSTIIWKAPTPAAAPAAAPATGEGARGSALDHLLRRLFRIKEFRPAQRDSIELLLQQRSLLAALPAGMGKSLLFQFAGLLQPAPSFVLSPLTSLAMDQQEALQDYFIDVADCLHESLGKEVRARVLRNFAARGTLFCLASAELFRTDEVVMTLEAMAGAGITFGQCVIDEAQTLSEWSHDFRPTMQLSPAFAAKHLPSGKDRTLPFRLFTASVSRDVLTDLRGQLASAGRAYVLKPDQIVRERNALNPAVQYYVFPTETTDPSPREVASVKLTALKKLLLQLPAFFKELQPNVPSAQRLPDEAIRRFFQSGRRSVGVVYCPHQSGALGVTDRYTPGGTATGIADRLTEDTDLSIGMFIGKDDSSSRVGRQVLAESANERRRFRIGETNLLVATRAYGIGIDHPHIRYALHMNIPAGLARFVQESGRAGRDGRLAVSAVFFTSSKQQRGPDAVLAEELLRRSMSTPEREKQLIHDLLREISYPEDSNTNRIANMIAAEFGVELRVNYWHRGLDERMYLQEGGNSYGYVDLVTLEIVPDEQSHDRAFARELLEFAFENSLEAAGSGPSISSWVSATFPSDIEDGIARQMQDFDSGAEFTLRIGFENDREPLLNQIHQLLWHEAEIQIHRKLLSEVSSVTWDDFCIELEERSKKPGVFATIDRELRDRMLHFFNKLRTRTDTERVIKRLATLGVVADYSINPASRKFALTIAVRSNDEYREALEHFMRNSLPEGQVARQLDSLASYPGDSILERCLYFLIDFTYQNPYQKQLESVQHLELACRHGIESGPAEFRDYIDLSLTAKYARVDHLPSILAAGAMDRFAVIGDYIRLLEDDLSGSILENAEQLRASCQLLGAQVQNEPLLTALEAFGMLLLSETEKEAEHSRARFIEQVSLCAAAQDRRGQDYLDAIAPWMQVLRRYFSQEDTGLLREGLEAVVQRIPKTAAKPAPMASTGRQKAKELPDIMAERQAAQSAAPEVKTISRKEDPAPSPRPSGKTVSSKAGGEEAAGRERPAETSQSEPGTQDLPGRSSPAATGKTRPEPAPKVQPKPAVPAPPPGPVETEEDILRALEAEFLAEQTSRAEKKTDSPAPAARSFRTETARQPAERERNAEAAGIAKRPAEKKQSETDREIDDLLADIEKTLSVKPAPRKVQPVAAPPKPTVDPMLAHHLKWLRTFNTTFLNAYESRNARLAAGTRKRA
jgi:ATP-dependent DNA helicase RecQ